MYQGDAHDPLERVYSEESPVNNGRQFCPEHYSSLRNLQYLEREEDEGLTVDRITIPDAKISIGDIKHCQRHNGPRVLTPYLE